MNFIPYGRQLIDEDDIRAVLRVLRSDLITQGPRIAEFEKALASYCGAAYAVAVSSGTAALHIACLAAGIEKGDEVITTPITFAASANSVEFCSGKAVFADISERTGNIDPEEVKKKITTRTKAIIPVHFSGLPCDMKVLADIAGGNGKLAIIEDACHALGAQYKEDNVSLMSEKSGAEWLRIGSGKYSHMTVFSFHPVKHITTGEGGAVLTNDAELHERLTMLRNHGITKDVRRFTAKDTLEPDESYGPWYYEMQMLGFNYRITDIQCALGISQLNKIEAFVRRRREIAAIYNDAFRNIQYVNMPLEFENVLSSYHLYPLQIDFKRVGKSRGEVMRELSERGIGTQVHYIPVHLQPYYRNKYGYKTGDYPHSERYYQQALSIPLYPGMLQEEVERVIHTLKECLNVK